jgi:hypothetical protein
MLLPSSLPQMVSWLLFTAYPECRDRRSAGADPSVWVKHDLIHGVAGIPNRTPLEQFAAARFGFLSCQHSLAYNLELDGAECPFDTQHQLIVEITQIVDLLLISD